MPKIYINDTWVDVDNPAYDIGGFDDAMARISSMELQAADLKASIPDITSGLVKTSITTPVLRKKHVTSTGYATEGGCIDDTYVYFYVKSSSDSDPGTIVKLKRSDYSHVKTNSSINLYHGNDLTYNPDTKRIYCATMYKPTGSSSRVAVIDPSTLKLIENKTLPYYISAIAYEPTRKMFVGAYGGNMKFVFRLDENGDFVHVKNIAVSSSPSYSDGWSSQGIACDGAFIYHVWTGSSKNWRVEICDWLGNYKGYMSGTQGKELEWIDKTSKHGFITGQLSYGGARDCNIYTFSQK